MGSRIQELGTDSFGPLRHVTAVTPSNATDLVATAGTDGSVRFWTSTDASCVREVHCSDEGVSAASWNSTGTHLAVTGAGRGLKIIRCSDGQVKRGPSGHNADVTAVAWSPNGEILASGCSNGTVRLWTARTPIPSPITSLLGHEATITALAWDRDSRTLASASLDGTVRLWERATQIGLGPIGEPNAIGLKDS